MVEDTARQAQQTQNLLLMFWLKIYMLFKYQNTEIYLYIQDDSIRATIFRPMADEIGTSFMQAGQSNTQNNQ